MKISKTDKNYNLELTKNEAAALAVVIGATSVTNFRDLVSRANGAYGAGDFGVDADAISNSHFFFDLYDGLKTELEKPPEVKLGQFYLHDDGDKYIVAKIDLKYSLICVSSGSYLGSSYGVVKEDINDVFGYNRDRFTLVQG